MQMDSPDWGKYALEVLPNREQAEERYQWWSERATSIPGAEVRVWSWKDPLGGESFMLMTQTLELMPEEWRRQRDEAVRQRIEELRQIGSPEDRGAVELAARMIGMSPTSKPSTSRHTVESLEARLRRIEERLRKLHES